MHYRLYSKITNDYLPQDKWLIRGDGKVVDLLSKYEEVVHDPSGFIIEPWTGYFDSNGKKVYCGDILEMSSMFDFKSKVVWKNGAFKLIPIDPEGLEEDMGRFGILKGWVVTSNIHNIEFLE